MDWGGEPVYWYDEGNTDGFINAPEYGSGGDCSVESVLLGKAANQPNKGSVCGKANDSKETGGVTDGENTCLTKPSLFDSDRDQLIDGLDGRSWKVSIIHDWTKDGLIAGVYTIDSFIEMRDDPVIDGRLSR